MPSRSSINFINNDKKMYSSDSDKSALPLKCLYTNAQSIVNKHFELQALVDLYEPD